MNKIISKKALTLILPASLIAIIGVSSVYAGSSPKGKPFIEIQGQFVEIQENIDDVEAAVDAISTTVDTLAGRVAANEINIDSLISENLLVEEQIFALIEQATETNDEVALAFTRINEILMAIEELSTEVNANTGEIIDNTYDIRLLEDELGGLRETVTANVEGVQSLQTQIDNNYLLIDGLQSQIDEANTEIAKKQAFLQGECPEGSMFRVINPDGSFECETQNTTGPIGVRHITVNNSFTVPGYSREPVYGTCSYGHRHGFLGSYHMHYYQCVRGYRTVYHTGIGTATCPAETILESGGYSVTGAGQVLQNKAVGDSWQVEVRNASSTPLNVFVNAECLQVFEIEHNTTLDVY